MLKLFIAVQNKLAMAREEHGQTMAEYGVVLAVITIGIVVALGAARRRHQRCPQEGHRKL